MSTSKKLGADLNNNPVGSRSSPGGINGPETNIIKVRPPKQIPPNEV